MSLFDYENLTKEMIISERIHYNIYYNNADDFYRKLQTSYELERLVLDIRWHKMMMNDAKIVRMRSSVRL